MKKLAITKLTRREILEQLIRLGNGQASTLKKRCREFERYWEGLTNHHEIKLQEIRMIIVR